VDNGANAAYLACQILALKYDGMKKKLEEFRARMKADFERENPPSGINLEDQG
jgi:5-(carboxyamino)imidazole ribonucleotide mutase